MSTLHDTPHVFSSLSLEGEGRGDGDFQSIPWIASPSPPAGRRPGGGVSP